METLALMDEKGLRYWSSEIEEQRPQDGSSMSVHLRIGDFIPAPDFSKFSEPEIELLNKMIEFEGICPEAEWMVALKAKFLNEGLVFNNKLYAFDEDKDVVMVEDFDELEAFTKYGTNEDHQNEDHRGLDKYDQQWMHDRRITVTDLVVRKDCIHLLMPGNNARKYDVIYLNPWPFNENGYEVIDAEGDGWLTIRADIMADLDYYSQDSEGLFEADHARTALLEQYKIAGVIYKLNRQSNIDFRGSDYDGPDERPAGTFLDDEECFEQSEEPEEAFA